MSVLPLASTGTVVSSPCRRSAARTWASKQSNTGRQQRRAQAPTWSARVDRLDRHALARIALGLAVQRLMLAELLEHDHRQQARPGPAARNDMERRRRLADASRSRGRRTSRARSRSPSTGAGSPPASRSRPRRACAGARRRSRRRPSALGSPRARAADARETVCARAACA